MHRSDDQGRRIDHDGRVPDEPIFPDEPAGTPDEHPLRRLFRDITRKAFLKFEGLRHPDVEDHISEGVLSEFVHVDRIFRLRGRGGETLADLTDMVMEVRASSRAAGVERDLEIHQYTGDYALFIAGLFPQSLTGRRSFADKPLLACVGSLVVTLNQPRDYYIVEGRSAYSHVARLYRRLDPPRSGLFDRLANRFEGYLEVMGCIGEYLRGLPARSGGEGGSGRPPNRRA